MVLGLFSLLAACFKQGVDLKPRLIARVNGPIAAELFELAYQVPGKSWTYQTAKVVVHRPPPVEVEFKFIRYEASLRSSELYLDDKAERVAIRIPGGFNLRVAYLRPELQAVFSYWPERDFMHDLNERFTSWSQVPTYSFETLATASAERELNDFPSLIGIAGTDFGKTPMEYLIASYPYCPREVYVNNVMQNGVPDHWEVAFAQLSPTDKEKVVARMREDLAEGTTLPIGLLRALDHIELDDKALAGGLVPITQRMIEHHFGEMLISQKLFPLVEKYRPHHAGPLACRYYEQLGGRWEYSGLTKFALGVMKRARYHCPAAEHLDAGIP